MMYPIYKPLAEDALVGFVRFLTDRDLMWRRSPVPTESQTSDMSENGPGTTTWSMYGGRLGGTGSLVKMSAGAARRCGIARLIKTWVLLFYGHISCRRTARAFSPALRFAVPLFSNMTSQVRATSSSLEVPALDNTLGALLIGTCVGLV